MRYLLALACLSLVAMAPVYTDYGNDSVRDEFRNIYQQAQPIQYRTFNSTPNLTDLQDGQIVIVSSNTFIKLMFRVNQEIYAVNGSCVTIRR